MGEKARNTLPAREIILACFVKSSNLREFTCLKQSHNQAQINSLKFAAAPASTISKEVHYDPRTNPHHRLITRTNSRTGEYSASTAQHRRKSAAAQLPSPKQHHRILPSHQQPQQTNKPNPE